MYNVGSFKDINVGVRIWLPKDEHVRVLQWSKNDVFESGEWLFDQVISPNISDVGCLFRLFKAENTVLKFNYKLMNVCKFVWCLKMMFELVQCLRWSLQFTWCKWLSLWNSLYLTLGLKSQNGFERGQINSIFKKFAEILQLFVNIFSKILPPLKHILALQT